MTLQAGGIEKIGHVSSIEKVFWDESNEVIEFFYADYLNLFRNALIEPESIWGEISANSGSGISLNAIRSIIFIA